MAMTWQQKYDNARPAKVRKQEKPFADLEPGEVVVIPSPQDVERALWQVPHGQTRSQRDLRIAIAHMYDADNASQPSPASSYASFRSWALRRSTTAKTPN